MLGGAVAVSALGVVISRRMTRPLLVERFDLRTTTRIDRPLILGAGLFGIDWGLSGFYPGPALASLSLGLPRSLLFVVATLIGMVLHDRRPRPTTVTCPPHRRSRDVTARAPPGGPLRWLRRVHARPDRRRRLDPGNPLLLYVVGLGPHQAIGTGASAVSASAFANFATHSRAGNVRCRSAGLFALIGMIGALIGSELGKSFDGKKLLFLFAILMIVVGIKMFRSKEGKSPHDVPIDYRYCNRQSIPNIALAVGALSGVFGIGGGFLIVTALLVATGMPMLFAVGTSLLAAGAFGLTTAANDALPGPIDRPVLAETSSAALSADGSGCGSRAASPGRKRLWIESLPPLCAWLRSTCSTKTRRSSTLCNGSSTALAG